MSITTTIDMAEVRARLGMYDILPKWQHRAARSLKGGVVLKPLLYRQG
jgi:hypothetical protein